MKRIKKVNYLSSSFRLLYDGIIYDVYFCGYLATISLDDKNLVTYEMEHPQNVKTRAILLLKDYLKKQTKPATQI